LQPNIQGPLELEDVETGERLSVSLDADAMASYRQRVTEWREGIARTCSGYGAAYAPVLTNWPLEQQVVPYLRARRFLV
jgi:hypothetical protein